MNNFDDDYEFKIEIGQGITMPGKDAKYKIQVSVQNHDWISDVPKETKGEYMRWHQRMPENSKKGKSANAPLVYSLPKNERSYFSGKPKD